MIDSEVIHKCIRKGLEFLEQEQNKAGYFTSLTSHDAKNFDNAYVCQSVFSTTIILSCLESVREEPLAAKVRTRAARFLLGQKSAQWTFNYWNRESGDYRQQPYPDDLDDTACALTALFQYDRELMSGEVLAHVVEVLTALEAQEGGPYQTWVVAPEAALVWKDVDVAVNANIAFFLSLQDVILPNLERFFDQAIADESYASPYYVGPFPIVYFLSRSYRGEHKDRLIRFILGRRNEKGVWGHPQETALALSALLRLGVPVSELKMIINEFVGQQDDMFRPYPFYTGINPFGDDRKYVAGSAALSVALCIEALGQYLVAQRDEVCRHVDRKQTEVSRGCISLRDRVTNVVRRRIACLPEVLQGTTMAMLEETTGNDKDRQITLLSWYFRTALGGKAAKISQQQIILLGAANTHGWMAYTAYDDILDGEGGVQYLPAANVCLREVVSVFTGLFTSNDGFLKFFQESMDRMEAANAWEVSQCQNKCSETKMNLPMTLPDYGRYTVLANRSYGHILGPLAICALSGAAPDSGMWRHTLTFFQNFLIARQLNDDMHDWEEDMRRGRISSVGAHILGIWMKKYPSRRRIVWKRDILELQEIAWHHSIPHMCEIALEHIKMAERALADLELTQPVFFERLLRVQESIVEKTLGEQRRASDFLRVYHDAETKSRP